MMLRVSTGYWFTVLATTLLLTPAATAGASERLEDRLASTLKQVNASYEGYEHATVPEDGHPKTYLLLDFEGDNLSRREQRQERIHHICSRILTNRDLVEDLSRRGVHMVSVAFDRQYQYDCL
ncbi:hypothetical protein CK501_03735 [Halovibrio salipaludis]|uniref:Uncharacterized protein n=1 Tax=Halovibrio salipaludis TaxID=2032626 RepID=A0A2A2FC57_9GAMM|nr:hypothetical protein [Halovibrio salipaludis]PAU82267.1 hypothetical protein CK501_03735 [Halovibrio salipaludis]